MNRQSCYSRYSKVNSGLTDSIVLTLNISGNLIYAGTDNGNVFISPDYGEHWRSINTGMPSTNVLSILVNDSTVYAGTGSFGVWQRSLKNIPGIESSDQMTSYLLVYPNPASDKIFIEINDPSRESYVSIFDIRGNQILEKKFQNKKSMELDVSNLSMRNLPVK